MKGLISIIFISFILFSCGQTGNDTRSTSLNAQQQPVEQQVSSTSCSCSQEYVPVCGNNGVFEVTFINSCLAQCNNMNFSNGFCPSSGTQTQCSTNGTVCAKSSANAQPQTYANDCARKLDGAVYIAAGDCP